MHMPRISFYFHAQGCHVVKETSDLTETEMTFLFINTHKMCFLVML